MSTTQQTDKEEQCNPRCGDIAAFKQWTETQPHLPNIDNQRLGVFLKAAGHDLDRAKMLLEINLTLKTLLPMFFDKRDPSGQELQCAIGLVETAILLGHDTAGNIVVMGRLKAGADPAQFSFSIAAKLFLMTSEVGMIEHGDAPGMIAVFDMASATPGHLLRMNIAEMRNFILFLQDASVLPVNGVHFINGNVVLEKILSVTRSMFNAKLFQVTHVHSETKSLFKFVPKEAVPADYGGLAGQFIDMHKTNCNKLVEHAGWFKRDAELRVDETKRTGKMDRFGLEESINDITID